MCRSSPWWRRHRHKLGKSREGDKGYDSPTSSGLVSIFVWKEETGYGKKCKRKLRWGEKGKRRRRGGEKWKILRSQSQAKWEKVRGFCFLCAARSVSSLQSTRSGFFFLFFSLLDGSTETGGKRERDSCLDSCPPFFFSHYKKVMGSKGLDRRGEIKVFPPARSNKKKYFD